MLDFYQGNTGVASDQCLIELNSIDAGSRYELIVKSESETVPINEFTFNIGNRVTSMVFLSNIEQQVVVGLAQNTALVRLASIQPFS